MYKFISIKTIRNYALAIGGVAVGLLAISHMNKPLEYEFSSVYDGTKHQALIYTDGNSKYATKCAEELADNFIKAGLGNFDISYVDNGEYTLVFYNSEKIN